ncbi:MAG: hypothetical protein AB1744_15895, partial [Candidatus Zixiibacteriota bacterium]
MTQDFDYTAFHRRLDDFRPRQFHQSRVLALYSAAIATADEDILSRTVRLGQQHQIRYDSFYEVILQSYLFLGFPRMLQAAEHLSRLVDGPEAGTLLESISTSESDSWFNNGLKLCRRVYGESYDALRQKVESFAPEIFRWMV